MKDFMRTKHKDMSNVCLGMQLPSNYVGAISFEVNIVHWRDPILYYCKSLRFNTQL